MPRPLRQEPCLSKCDWAPTGETRDEYLVFACAGIPLKTYSMLVNGAFAGAGATRVSCTVNCATMWAFQLPLAWALGNAFGAPGIYAAMLCANAGSAFWYARLYAGKKWLEYGMRKRQNA